MSAAFWTVTHPKLPRPRPPLQLGTTACSYKPLWQTGARDVGVRRRVLWDQRKIPFFSEFQKLCLSDADG